MQRKLVSVAVLAMAGTLLFCGVSLAGLCSDLGKDAGCVRSVDIKNQTVRAADILSNAITGYKIKDGSIRGRDLADGSVTTAKIKDGTIRARDLADGCVTAAKLDADVDIAALVARIAVLEDLLQHFTRVDNDIFIDGANVHITNGTGSTGGVVNGLGNLIVGYNELRNDGSDDRTGSHNFVGGIYNNFSSYGGLVVGVTNTISGSCSSVSGGSYNEASGGGASISGGYNNDASGIDSSVSGGHLGTASGDYSSVSGGIGNEASGYHSSVSGGTNNTASGEYASVSGGVNNLAYGIYTSVSGGAANAASGNSASVSGGFNRDVSGDYDWRAGSCYFCED